MFNQGKMVISNRLKEESLLEYSFRLSELYKENQQKDTRKDKGQFFTALNIAKFMASLANIKKPEIRILDPGVGTGILTGAIFDRIIQESKNPIKIYLDVYETDKSVISLLNSFLLESKRELSRHNHYLSFNIYDRDFVITNSYYIEGNLKTGLFANQKLYDIVISNPPYFKLSKNSPEAVALKSLVNGQPNIYAFFMAISAAMLNDEGQMIFITPRSFCSGLYYSKFRKWFVNHIKLTNIHLFSSRKDVFSNEDVLQENIILKAIKKKGEIEANTPVKITTSEDDTFIDLKSIEVPYSKIIYKRNGDLYILIPTSALDLEIFESLNKFPHIMKHLNIGVSTGPVVPFRTKENLIYSLKENDDKIVPLLWMHNFVDLELKWPVFKNGNPIAIKKNENTKGLLIKKGNYVILKRFGSKEQKRRLQAAVLLEEDFKNFSQLGLENRLNYIYKKEGNLKKEEALGIATILNLNITDLFFRMLNGHTQINANELNALPLPDLNKIIEVGMITNEVN